MRTRSLGALLALVIASTAASQVDAQAHFLRGDANHDRQLDLADAVFTLSFLFTGGSTPPCADAADTNDDGGLDISDGVALLNYLFVGGIAPAAPFPVFEADPTADGLTCLGAPIEKSGVLSSSETWSSNNSYRLISAVIVPSGVTLTINAGTTVLGDSATNGLLVVDRGGRLVCNGTATHPIVFTSDRPVGERGRGDWGGLVLLGRGDNNVDGKEALAEGLDNRLWGGGANVASDDSSGSLSYVRVEFGGTEISPDNEVNAISLFGCGSGTNLDHVQVKYNLDDGFEWFGGAADLKYGLAVGIGDDSFDYSFGWSGKGQFWVCQQSGDDADRGFEVDNSESQFGATPRTVPTITNVTLVGDPDTVEGTESTQGLLIRRGAGTRLYNAIVTGFKGAGIDLDDGATTNHQPGNLVVDHTIFHNVSAICQSGETGANEESAANGFAFTTCDFINTIMSNNTLATDAPVVDPYNLGAPNFRPQNAAISSAFDPSTLGSFFEPAMYAGAVAPAGADWTKAPWISYARN